MYCKIKKNGMIKFMWYKFFSLILYEIKIGILKLLGYDTNFFVQLDITNKCQLKCVNCYKQSFKDNSLNTINDWTFVIGKIISFSHKLCVRPHYVLCGGEPFLSEHFFKIINFLKINYRSTPDITIISNGISITEQQLDIIKRENIIVQISIDGPNSLIHDAVRGFGSFEQSIKNISRLIANNVSTHCLVTLTKTNHHHIKDFFDLFSNIGIKSFTFHRYIPHDKNDNRVLNKQELKNAYKDILNMNKLYGGICDTHKPLYALLDNSINGHGQWGAKSIVIDIFGNIKPSSRTDMSIGNINTDDLYNAFYNNEIMKKLRNNLIVKCCNCEFVFVCAGDRNAAYAASGDLLQEDPLCWKE